MRPPPTPISRTRPAALAHRRLGVAAERDVARSRCARAALRGRRAPLSRRRRPASAALGRLSRRAVGVRVLAGPPVAAARSHRLRAGRRRAGASGGSRRDALLRTQSDARRAGHARHDQPRRAVGQPRHGHAGSAARGRVDGHGRRAARAVRAAADALRGRRGPAVRPHRRAQADARRVDRASRSARRCRSCSRAAGPVRERLRDRPVVHGRSRCRRRTRPASWARPRSARRTSACWRSATRSRASSGRSSPASRSTTAGFVDRVRDPRGAAAHPDRRARPRHAGPARTASGARAQTSRAARSSSSRIRTCAACS